MLTESMQDYLKTIYEMVENGGRATTNALAEHRGVTAASVTGMLKKLAELKLVEYERYQGVLLTKAGEQIALSVIRHHRLMELYLTETMGYSWDRVHAEADKLEHVISEEFVDKVSALLGNPQHDPHGSPIPSKEGAVAASSQLALSDVPVGRTVQVQHVTDENPALLREVAMLGLLPRVNLFVVASDSQTGSLIILVNSCEPDQQQRSVAHELAQHIFVIES
jgi:DtxR family Mn-dependent transcriptional regulator